MTRRIIIGQRPSGEMGIFVSMAGNDAGVAGDGGMLLSNTKQPAMMVQSGQATLGGTNIFVPFVRPVASKPAVFLWVPGDQFPALQPVKAVVSDSLDGFTAYAQQIWDGSYPANGATFYYQVIAKDR